MKAKIFALASLALAAQAVQAASLYSTGFESPTFTSGATINNKGAWHTGSFDGSGVAVTGASVIASTAQAHAGTQSALITAPAASGGSFVYGYHALTYDATTNALKTITEESYIWVAAQSFTSGDSGLADIEMDNGGSGYALAEAGIDTGTGDLIVGGYGTGSAGPNDYFFSFTGGPVAHFGAWNKVDLTIDYSASLTSPKVVAALNGVSVDGGLTVYDYSTTNGQAITSVGYGDIQLYGGDSTVADGTVTAYFDDFSATTASPVPEPSAFAALGLGAVAVLRRRKRA